MTSNIGRRVITNIHRTNMSGSGLIIERRKGSCVKGKRWRVQLRKGMRQHGLQVGGKVKEGGRRHGQGYIEEMTSLGYETSLSVAG